MRSGFFTDLLICCAGIASLLVATALQAQPPDSALRNDAVEPNNVLTYGMGYNAQRFSTLAQINKDNVKKLVPVWSLALESQAGEVGQPMVLDGVMFVANAHWTVAIDARFGEQLWRTATYFDSDAAIAACCGVSNRGVALYNGLAFRGTLDAHMVALDQKTGKEVWKTKVANWKESYTITSAPLIANGVLITGMSGGDFGTRGFIDAYDPNNGELLWRQHTTAAPGEPGGDTWTVKDAYKTGGASTWITGSYDPALDLVYWGTGNTGPWNPKFRGGDSLYAASVIAFRPKTGEVVWHYQFTPNDMFDYDAVGEFILAELEINGKERNVMLQLNKNRFAYILDRATGELLAANAYAKTNWATHIDLKSGRPVETPLAASLRAGNKEILWPSFRGAKNWAHAAFNPLTGLLYANTIQLSSTYRITDPGPVKLGKWWIGATEFKFLYEDGAVHGHMEAIDPQALIKGVQPNFESFESQFSELVYEETATYYAQYKSYVSQRDVIKRQITQREQELRRQRNQATSLIREVGLIQDQLDIENSAKGRATISKLDILSRETRLAERENSLRESEDSIAVSESAVQEAKERLRELNANKLGELRVADSEVLAEIAEAKKTLIKSNDKVDRLEIRAPVNGFIEDLKITAIGGVIKPGQDILTVVPSDEDLIVEARVSTTDIGHVHVGLAADVKVTSYDAFRFGSITGSVRRLSASTYLDEQEIPYYLAEVALEHDYVGENSQLKVIPGMTVSADIKTGKKTILSYLVKPISRGFSQSFQER